jgi:hypothetical protein
MQWTDQDAERLRRLLDRADRDPSFSKEDADLLREMIRVYRGIRAWGMGARFLVVVLAGLAGGLAAWEVVTERVGKWFGG